ncbi:hemerythrin domain-containing protein [Janibacter sp. CX7]|uniref:hemerythrin domain-containing protein n=1 Tax=Janibacter sp. CX7 TaxID=2963431 RepID=UPI0020CE91E9|nr:hemerythrin domain-containing protein [Janibacter sp. CX7]UTT65937.1 hemerythrin domain-containing protein [Janibacter sp. CX7]
MCSYCGCQSIGVIGRFTAEHEQIINASGLLRRAAQAGRTDEVVELVDEVAALLTPHTDAEEVGLFTVLRRDEDFTEYVDALCGEHVTLDELLERIRAGESDLADRFYKELRSHIEREEDGLFPASLTTLRGDDWTEVDELTAAAFPVSPLAPQ